MQKCLWCTAIDETGIFRPPDVHVANHWMRNHGGALPRNVSRPQDSPHFKESWLFSDYWRSAFFNRFKLALQKFTTTKSILRDKAKVTEIVQDFHLQTCSFLMSKPIDPISCIAPPKGTWNHDQVFIAMCSSEAKTLDMKGNPTILNSLAGFGQQVVLYSQSCHSNGSPS
jgi:hypothetical protein